MRAVCHAVAFSGEGRYLIAGTGRGHLLVWDTDKFWTPSFWLSPVDEASQRPLRTVQLFAGPIYRLLVFGDRLLVAGVDGLKCVRLVDFTLIWSLPCEAVYQCFNALCRETDSSVLVGTENGAVIRVKFDVESTSEELVSSEPFEFPHEYSQSAILDITVSPSSMFCASAAGFIWAFDRETSRPIYKIDLRRGEVVTTFAESNSVLTSFRASLVRLDPSGKWLLAGCGGNSKEPGFISIWHAEAREAISVLPLRSVPSGVVWLRGSVVAVGAENAVYQYDLKGKVEASAVLEGVSEIWDVCEYHHPDDIIGAAIALAADCGSVLLLTAVGRKPIVLSCE